MSDHALCGYMPCDSCMPAYLAGAKRRLRAYIDMTREPCRCGHHKERHAEVVDPLVPNRSARDWAWPAGKCSSGGCKCVRFMFPWASPMPPVTSAEIDGWSKDAEA